MGQVLGVTSPPCAHTPNRIPAAVGVLFGATKIGVETPGINSLRIFLGLFVATLLLGCATQPKDLPTAYVSPLQYKDYSCDQISMEMSRVSKKVNELRGGLKEQADNDSAQMAIGLIIFWPALFFLEGGDGADAAEFSRLKGEFEALEQVSIHKSCGIQVQQSDS